MDWSAYKQNFQDQALSKGKSNRFCENWLEYAKVLFEKDLPVIFDLHHLSLLVGYKYSYLRSFSTRSDKYYRVFSVEKRNGDLREISAPLPSLKEVQKWILVEILEKLTPTEYAKAFRRGFSIKDGAKLHKRQKVVMALDIKNFFSSLRKKKVNCFFISLGYSVDVSKMLTDLCVKENVLPQGAPTSPALSNLLMMDFDKRLASYCRKLGIRYSRYADDIVFSGDIRSPNKIIKFVVYLLAQEGLSLNHDKTKVMRAHKRQMVTGVVVNQFNRAPKGVIRKLRQELYYIKKFGLNAHLEVTQNTHRNHREYLIGLAEYILFLNENDRDAKNIKSYFSRAVDES